MTYGIAGRLTDGPGPNAPSPFFCEGTRALVYTFCNRIVDEIPILPTMPDGTFRFFGIVPATYRLQAA